MTSYRVTAKIRKGYELPAWYTDAPQTFDQAQRLVTKLREWEPRTTVLQLVINEARMGYTQAPYRAGRIVREDGAVEAVRFFKSEGAAFSGWIVRSTTDDYSVSDPIATKAEAVEALLRWDL